MEGLALGFVKMEGPVSAYAIAAAFAHSPSSYWSGSAGAIYPLVRRLKAAGLLKAEKGQTGKRKHTLYRLTNAGEAGFQDWLLDTERAVNPGFDPLRSRLSMLHLVREKDRMAFMSAVEDKLVEQKDIVLPRAHASERFRDLHKSWLGHRLRWLRDLRKHWSQG
jgi:DNA-binding PadR family transcriptional regulator